MIIRRLNLLPFHHTFAELSPLKRNYIISALIQHTIADLGFHITLTDLNPSKYRIENMTDMKAIIFELTFSALNGFYPPSYCITVSQIANFVYQLNIEEV